MLILLLLSSCAGNLQNGKKEVITQGLAGKILFWEGDFMPGINAEARIDQKKPVVRQVFVHELTKINNLQQVDPAGFYEAIPTKRIAEVWSDSTGRFAIALPTGKYSVFIREDSLFYANGSDGEGNIWPVEVKKDSVSNVELDITYKATF